MVMVVYIVLIVLFMYFFLIRPQKKEQKKMTAMLSQFEVGDSVLTTGGFYGIVIDITDDTVIVEFGNNKTAVFRCRNRQSHRLRSRALNLTTKNNVFYERRLQRRLLLYHEMIF